MLYSLGVGVLRDFNKLKADSQSKNILAWTPVVSEILDGFCRFDRQDVCTSQTIHYENQLTHELHAVHTVPFCGLPIGH